MTIEEIIKQRQQAEQEAIQALIKLTNAITIERNYYRDKCEKEGKGMIEELKEQIYGWDHEGKPAVAGPPTLEDVINKVNEIIRYLNATQRK